MNNIKYFTIYGERCSGTNFLEELITNNFNIQVTWKYGWKHFFGFYNFNKTQEENETLFIGIVRNPIDWLYSFHTNPHHVPPHNKPLMNFLNNEFYSISNINGKTIIEDFHYETKKKYKDIFELRKVKNNFLVNVMPTKVNNYILINYEDLLVYTDYFINKISIVYNLPLKNDSIIKIEYYKKNKNKKYEPKKTYFSNEMFALIKDKLDINQEKGLNYII